MSAWESIDLLVFNREASTDLVSDAYSDSIIISWLKLERYVTDLRDDLQRDMLFEWCQWLAERMIDREKTESPITVCVAHRDWE